MEPLTLALLVLPGDPGNLTGPVLEHPEVLLAKGRAGKVVVKVFIKLLRALRKRRPSELHELYPEWWGVWRYGSAAPYWKVRVYCRVVPLCLLTAFATLLSGGFGLLALLCVDVIESSWGYTAAMSITAAFAGVLLELMGSCYAIKRFLDAALRGEGLRGCLHAFKLCGVYGLSMALIMYVLVIAAAIAVVREDLRSLPLPVRASSLAALIAPEITGLWTLWWGLWVVS